MAAYREVGAASLQTGAEHQAGETGQSSALHNQLQALVDKYGSEVVQLQFQQSRGQLFGNVADQPSDFPVRALARDPHDDVIARKIMAPAVLGEKQLTDADLHWLKRKDDQLENLAFRRFMATLYSGADLAQRRELLKVYPELIHEQQSVIDQRIDLAKQVAKIRLLGPQTEGDYRLMYLVSTGSVALPLGEIWDPSSWSDTSPDESFNDKVARGLFNPSRYNVTAAGGVHAVDLMGDALNGRFDGANSLFGNLARPSPLNSGVTGPNGTLDAFFASPNTAMAASARRPFVT